MIRWEPDILEGFEQTTIELGPDDAAPAGAGPDAADAAPLVATLVRYVPDDVGKASDDVAQASDGVGKPGRRPAVLYVHGYNDYFFHRHVAREWHARGYDFFALDLRRCGRSWRHGQTPHFVGDLRDYRAELTIATRIIRADHDGLVVTGHSTGGLTVSLWLHSVERGVVDALVLNSPWFDFHSSWFERTLGTRIVDVLGSLNPLRVLRDSPSRYAEALHVEAGGEWDYDRALKSGKGVPVRAGWFRAVRRGQARLARGLRLPMPVLVCTSAVSGPDGDDVLDVEQIVARAPGLGRDVTVARIEGGLHDLALSPEPARAEYFRVVFDWLERQEVGGRGAP